MAYHTSVYLFLFLPISLLVYQLTSKKYRWFTLLVFDYIFFWLISKKLLLYLIGTTLLTHCTGVWIAWMQMKCKEATAGMERQERTEIKKLYKKREKVILTGGILCLLLILAYLKYYNFFALNLNGLFRTTGIPFSLESKSLVAPVGISYYTLQAIGYMADVYWGKSEVCWHPGKTALFLSFFPQIMEGPISMYDQTAENLWNGNDIKGENLSAGSIRIIWGLFKKMIVADRLNVLVSEIFGNSSQYYGIMIIIGAIAYTVQLYMEFSGCMDIIIGSGRLFGVVLPENFRQPFFAGNAAEFWRRWHITLGVWFKTYVFYPVSMSALAKKWNKFGKEHLSKYMTRLGISAIALFPVWLCNGLWHGPKWNYIFYGMYYFVLLLVGIAVEPVRERILKLLHIDPQTGWYKLLQMMKTWVIIFTGEMFFRADGLKTGIRMFTSIFKGIGLERLSDGTLVSVGLDRADYYAILAGCLVVAIVEVIKEKKLAGEMEIQKLKLPLRWALYYSLIFAVIIFGAYGIGYQQVDMIYAGF